MKDRIMNIVLTLIRKKDALALRRKLDLLSSLSGKRCLGCRRFLYDVSFDNSFCPTCMKEKPPAWVKYDLDRQRREKEALARSEKKGMLVRVNFEGDKKGYQILHPCEKCGIWNEIFLSKAILKLSEHQIKTPKSLRFVTSLDPQFQLKIKKGIDKEFDAILNDNEREAR